MKWMSHRTAAAFLGGGACAGSLFLAVSLRAQPAPQANPAVLELSQALLETATEARKEAEAMHSRGMIDFDEVLRWSRLEMEAKLDLAASKADRIALLENYLKLAREHEATAEARQRAGLTNHLALSSAKMDRLKIEIRLADARAQ